ncbi:MAG: Sortase family [Frankiales bacterium]|nr:Sortase family [Frankiales bacterium]
MTAGARASALAAGVAVLAAVTGLALVRVGGGEVRPGPAPLPTRTFSEQGPPPRPSGPSAASPSSGATPAASPAGGQWADTDPSMLYVSSLGIAAPIVDAPIQGTELVGPGDVRTVGRWLGGAGLSSKVGTVDLAGHVNYVGQGAGALQRLYQVQPGALVVTTDPTGRRTSWRVTGLAVVAKDALPTALFAPTGPRLLKIITCGGALIRQHNADGDYYSYADNVIATAVPA